MQLVPPDAAASRARAAIAYAGLEISELAEKSGIKAGTIRNVISKTRPTGGTIERLWAIADACSVPRWFMEQGFELEVHHIVPLSRGGTSEPDNLELVDPATHRALHAMEARIAEIESSLLIGRPESDVVITPSGVDERRQPPGELGRDARGSTPSSQHPSPAGSERAGGSQRGNGEA